MDLNYSYRKNPRIEKCLRRIEILREVAELLPRLPHVEDNLRRRSLLKSSLFSARIEGNRLQLKDVRYTEKNIHSKDLAQMEIFNILAALRWLYSERIPKKLTLSLIFKLHKSVMRGISAESGHFRKEPSAIFNQAGVAIYFTPPPSQIFSLTQKFMSVTNFSNEPGPIQAAICHFTFEKIHPFLDGNGRVGRLLSTFILKSTGFSFRWLVCLEEYYENKRELYYDFLANQKKDITPFVQFFLEGLSLQAEKAIEDIKITKTELPEDRLLPRRGEILAIIRDHRIVSFDFIRRRFAKIPESTLHYDIRKLIEAGFIKKLGSTRGVCYTASIN